MKLTDFSTVLFVDMQCCYDHEGYLFVKELCIQHFKNNVFFHSTYQPPAYYYQQEYSVKYAKANRWAISHHHQMSIREGARPYKYIFLDLERIFKNFVNEKTLIYVAGFEKIGLLINLLNGYENSRKIFDAAALENVLIFDIATDKANRNISAADCFNLSLQSTAEDRKKYLIGKFLDGKNPCIFHASYNCARLNCQYLLEKYYAVFHRMQGRDTPDIPSWSNIPPAT